jgi:hypothetical protein
MRPGHSSQCAIPNPRGRRALPSSHRYRLRLTPAGKSAANAASMVALTTPMSSWGWGGAPPLRRVRRCALGGRGTLLLHPCSPGSSHPHNQLRPLAAPKTQTRRWRRLRRAPPALTPRPDACPQTALFHHCPASRAASYQRTPPHPSYQRTPTPSPTPLHLVAGHQHAHVELCVGVRHAVVGRQAGAAAGVRVDHVEQRV